MKKQYIVIIILLTAFFGCNETAFAQVPSGANGGVMAYFQVGNSNMDLSELNNPLKTAGYSPMPENFITLGGGGHIFYKRLVIGGEGSSYIVNITASENNYASARLSGGHGFFNIGYLAYSGARWKVYPMLGIGGGKYNLEIVQNQNPNGNLVNVLTYTPLLDEKLQTGGFLLNLSLNISTAIHAPKSKSTAGPVILGVRGGYIIQPWMSAWTYEYSNVPSSSMCMQGWYAMFQVGFGVWSKPVKSTDNTLPDMPLPGN